MLDESNKTHKLLGFLDAKELIGFSYVIIADNCLYIMYLAINKLFRNKGYGSEVINILDKFYKPQTIYLSVEKPNGKDENRRIKFYQKNGFVLSGIQFDWLGTILIPMCKHKYDEKHLIKFLQKFFPEGKDYEDINIKT